MYTWEVDGAEVQVAASNMEYHRCWATDLSGADLLVIDQ